MMNQGQDSNTVATKERPIKTDPGIIIVTGANERIQAAVMRRFTGRFSPVVGCDRKSPNPPPSGCVYEPVEITSDEGVRAGLSTLRRHHGAHIGHTSRSLGKRPKRRWRAGPWGFAGAV